MSVRVRLPFWSPRGSKYKNLGYMVKLVDTPPQEVRFDSRSGSSPEVPTKYALVVEMEIHAVLKPQCLRGLRVRVPPGAHNWVFSLYTDVWKSVNWNCSSVGRAPA